MSLLLRPSLHGGLIVAFLYAIAPTSVFASELSGATDAGAAAAIHEQIQLLVGEGAGALVISQDLDEIFALCDRIAVISQGTLSTPQPADEVTVEAVGLLMGASGAVEQERAHA